MIQRLNLCFRFLYNEGFFTTWSRFFDSVRFYFKGCHRLNFYKLALDNYPKVVSSSDDFVVEEVLGNEVSRLVTVAYVGQDELNNWFKEGKRCFVVLSKEQIVSYMWVSPTKQYVPEIKCSFHPPNNSVFFFNARTLKGFRGRGVFNRLLAGICSTLSIEGFESIYVTILSHNVPSINAFLKNGFEEYAFVELSNKLGKSVCIASQTLPITAHCELKYEE